MHIYLHLVQTPETVSSVQESKIKVYTTHTCILPLNLAYPASHGDAVLKHLTGPTSVFVPVRRNIILLVKRAPALCNMNQLRMLVLIAKDGTYFRDMEFKPDVKNGSDY